MKLLLSDWAARHYSPPPPHYTLLQWARNGEIFPPAERVGKVWYVDESARRGNTEPTLLERIKADEADQRDKTPYEWHQWLGANWRSLVFSRETAAANTREFYDPKIAGGGVYIALSFDKTTPIYIGSSINAAHRMRNGGHVRADAPTFAFSVPDYLIRDIEASYIVALAPGGNANCPAYPISYMVQPIKDAWGIKQ